MRANLSSQAPSPEADLAKRDCFPSGPDGGPERPSLLQRLGWRWRRLTARRFVELAEGVNIDTGVRLFGGAGAIRVGPCCRMVTGATIAAPADIGERCWINGNAFIGANVTLGKRVYIGRGAILLTDGHVIGETKQRAGRVYRLPVRVGDGAWIGAGATVLPGITIGRGAVIGAGSVVTRDVPADCVYAGNPARLLRTL